MHGGNFVWFCSTALEDFYENVVKITKNLHKKYSSVSRGIVSMLHMFEIMVYLQNSNHFLPLQEVYNQEDRI